LWLFFLTFSGIEDKMHGMPKSKNHQPFFTSVNSPLSSGMEENQLLENRGDIMTKNRIAIRLLVVAMLLLPFLTTLSAWEKAVKVGLDGNEIRYHKPVIKTGPDGVIYMAYKTRAAIPNTTDIHLQTYDGTRLGVLGNINVSGMSRGTVSYEEDIEVGPDGRVHVVWMYYNSRIGRATPHQLLYRVWNGKTWSQTRNLLNFTCNYVEDTRLTVSPNGNVHVTWMTWDDSKIHLVGLYPQGVEYKSAPMAGRHKHPDVTPHRNQVQPGLCPEREQIRRRMDHDQTLHRPPPSRRGPPTHHHRRKQAVACCLS
jgi:hypothetical protein